MQMRTQLWAIREVQPENKKARSSFCSERTASERAMYGEKCFARFRAGMWKIDLHKLSCIYMDLQESGYQF